MPVRPTPLTLISAPRSGSRSAATCHYRCGDACSSPEPNTSDNVHFSDLVERSLTRRALLRGAVLGAGTLVVGHHADIPAAAAAEPTAGHPVGGPGGISVARGGWTPVPPNVRDEVTVAPGFRSQIVMSWGDAVLPAAPAFDVLRQTPESAALQFGYNCDYVAVLPLERDRVLLVCNHEYTNEELMYPAGVYDADTISRIAIQSHGMSVVELTRRRDGSFVPVPPSRSRFNRRITGSTEFFVDGPAAGDPRLRTAADPTGTRVLGTLQNCAGGTTPWGTILSGEENFNAYFDARDGATLDPRYTESYARYGVEVEEFRAWRNVDPRFDLEIEPHEPFRFGWIVEIDPYDPRSTPRKHTMLGRFKHEGANIAICNEGHAVAYMGDDQRGEYLYKFVSRDKIDTRPTRRARQRNMRLLSAGTLYAARLTGDGTQDGEYDGSGEWIPLASDTTSFVEGMTVADVLIDTRIAADRVGATKMDRPEDVEPHPTSGRVYAALTNNSSRGTAAYPVDEANPLGRSNVRSELGAPLTETSGNRNGYVVELEESGTDHGSTTFSWRLLLVCGDPEAPETYFAGYPKDHVSPISCPDNLAFDSVGNLWVATDGNALGSNDGLFRVPLAGPQRGQVHQFATVPVGAEPCGPFISHDDRAVWLAVQHPGETDGSTFESPSSTWPHTHAFPRPSVVVITS